jgi:hypothetical protein
MILLPASPRVNKGFKWAIFNHTPTLVFDKWPWGQEGHREKFLDTDFTD